MKNLYTFLLIIFFVSSYGYSQNASTYFPANTGYKWYYINTPLDSLNNPQPVGATYQVDSFATVQTYQGLQANTVLSKSGLANINQNAPFLDSSYYNFQTTNGWTYLSVLGLIDTNLLPGIGGFLRSFDGWYNVYRFAQTVNTNYTIFSRDTTISFDTLTLPLRFSAIGRRLNDQTVSTVNGNYLAKKFLTTFTISYGLLPPFIYIPIATRADSTFIAQDVWVVKDFIPTINVDLTSLGFPISFSIPGTLKELAPGAVGIFNQTNSIADGFYLSQNYPNPFNPVTNLEFGISKLGFVSLKVYNMLGKEVATLVNSNLNAGIYNYQLSTDNYQLTSGIYFYKLDAGDFVETKSMILLK
ncbi:MAG: T9SS type A sorting domain-containing protein [Bacteroidota bacterium]|nr:T9SS type A sorting domain-containing protein [Bacteroidota bacterium]